MLIACLKRLSLREHTNLELGITSDGVQRPPCRPSVSFWDRVRERAVNRRVIRVDRGSRPKRDFTVARELRRIRFDVSGSDTGRASVTAPDISAIADQASASAFFAPSFFTTFARAATNRAEPSVKRARASSGMLGRSVKSAAIGHPWAQSSRCDGAR
jgi:hypothetical protein